RGQRLRVRLRLDFIINEKEELALEGTNEVEQRTADRADHVVTSHFVARQTLHIAKEPVGIEPFVFSLIESFAVVVMGASVGCHADLHRAFTARIRAQTSS